MQGETSIWKKYRLLKSTEEKPFKMESFPNNESKIQVLFISANPLKCEYVQGFQAPKQTWETVDTNNKSVRATDTRLATSFKGV